MIWINELVAKDLRKGQQHRRRFPADRVVEKDYRALTHHWPLTPKHLRSSSARARKKQKIRRELEDTVEEEEIDFQIQHLTTTTTKRIRITDPLFYNTLCLENVDRHCAGPAFLDVRTGDWIVAYEVEVAYTKTWTGIVGGLFREKVAFYVSYLRLSSPTEIQGPTFNTNNRQAQEDSEWFDTNEDSLLTASLNIVRYAATNLNFNHNPLFPQIPAIYLVEDEEED